MTNTEFVTYLTKLTKTNSAYMWGTYGSKLTADLVKKKAAQYPTHFSAGRQVTLNKLAAKCTYIACDCCGMIKNAFFTDCGAHAIKYNSKYDTTASGMMNNCTNKGAIAKLPEVPGLFLYKTGHIGVYLGKGLVAECTLGTYGDGIVITKLAGRGWTTYGYSKWITYATEKIYVVQKGDSPVSIAKKFGIKSYKTLMTYNNIKAPYTLKVGQKLKIPASN